MNNGGYTSWKGIYEILKRCVGISIQIYTRVHEFCLLGVAVGGSATCRLHAQWALNLVWVQWSIFLSHFCVTCARWYRGWDILLKRTVSTGKHGEHKTLPMVGAAISMYITPVKRDPQFLSFCIIYANSSRTNHM